jgi:CRISPR-associated endonuclease/helicase Cas3
LKEEKDLDLDELRMALSSENWESPIVVTTAVQFFESLFSNKPSKCRKLHNIANSVIVFDEAQTLPASYLKPCVKMIAELVQYYGCSAILCTATQPALEELFRDAFENEQLHIPEIGSFTVSDKRLFTRNTIKNIGQQTVPELAGIINRHAQALCVLNTRAATQSLYDELGGTGKGDNGIYCLTTLQTSHDRMDLLQEIRGRLDSGEKCLVASTSLIEAGVDIDFPVAYREQAGLDSILQTAGRCNREGKLDPKSCTVSVFSTDSKTPSYIVQNVAAFKIVESSGQDIASDEAISQYFKTLLNLKGSKALDKNGIVELTEGKTESGPLPFAEIAAQFKLIDDITVPVYIPQDDKSTQLCKRLERPELNSRALFRQLGPYVVNVMPQHLQSLLASGTVRQVAEGSYVLTNTDKYSRSKGLELQVSGGEALFY